jgi:hypothetical protein
LGALNDIYEHPQRQYLEMLAVVSVVVVISWRKLIEVEY